jgi:gliding motility-associated-like protein
MLNKAKYVFFAVLLVISASNVFSQTIEKDGRGICPNGSIRLYINNPNDYTGFSWQIFDVTSNSWSSYRNGSSTANSYDLSTSDAGDYRLIAVPKSGGANVVFNTVTVVNLTSPPSIITPANPVHQICKGDALVLNGNIETGVYYNWRLNAGALNVTVPTLNAKEEGDYTLEVIDQTTGCVTTSAPYKISYFPPLNPVITPVPAVCATSVPTFNINANPTGGIFAGTGIVNTTVGAFSPSAAGVGSHTVTYSLPQNNGCPNIVESVVVKVNNPEPKITSSTGGNEFCIGQPASLEASTGFTTYEWKKDGVVLPEITAKLAITSNGTYSVKVQDSDNCTVESSPFMATFENQVQPSITSIPSVCGTNHAAVPLVGLPVGGVFRVNEQPASTFDYAKLGIGTHEVKYQISGALTCLNGTVSQKVVIQRIPEVEFAGDIFMWKGAFTILQSNITDPGYLYEWLPNSYLNDATLATPQAKPDATTTYTLRVKSPYGCQDEADVNVVVFEKIWIPDAFSPNNDNVNDFWVLSGINAYPEAEVKIYDRWGGVIFYSKGIYTPFDGTQGGKQLPAGAYNYHIIPFPNMPSLELKGTMMVFR